MQFLIFHEMGKHAKFKYKIAKSISVLYSDDQEAVCPTRVRGPSHGHSLATFLALTSQVLYLLFFEG